MRSLPVSLAFVLALAAPLASASEDATYPANAFYTRKDADGWRVEFWLNTLPGEGRPMNWTLRVFGPDGAPIAPAATLSILRPDGTVLANATRQAGTPLALFVRPDAHGIHTLDVTFADGRSALAIVDVKAFKDRRTDAVGTLAVPLALGIVAFALHRRR